MTRCVHGTHCPRLLACYIGPIQSKVPCSALDAHCPYQRSHMPVIQTVKVWPCCHPRLHINLHCSSQNPYRLVQCYSTPCFVRHHRVAMFMALRASPSHSTCRRWFSSQIHCPGCHSWIRPYIGTFSYSTSFGEQPSDAVIDPGSSLSWPISDCGTPQDDIPFLHLPRKRWPCAAPKCQICSRDSISLATSHGTLRPNKGVSGGGRSICNTNEPFARLIIPDTMQNCKPPCNGDWNYDHGSPCPSP